MLPLKVVFLWHQHQPDYRMNDVFLMPWTRLHGIKDYYDLPEILYEFPHIKQTVNMVPSLSKQISEYCSLQFKDKIQLLTEKKANLLTDEDKREIIRTFFRCQLDNMILPYHRYKELYERSRDVEYAVNTFSESDWLDLQVWYNLTWFGYFSRQSNLIKRLFAKEKDFTEDEKILLLQKQIQILSNIDNQLDSLRKIEQLEISCTPMYHPILPLLCDSRVAHEAMPNVELPQPLFNFPQDAILQLQKGIDYYQNIFNEKPNGIWPSEGSISNLVLNMMSDLGVKWTACDEKVLAESMGSNFIPTEKFFPRKFQTNNGHIAIFFRDHFLSDRIGFVYSQWNPEDAANDFCHHLRNIRNEIIRVHGEEALRHAAVSVILDGENCWEFYKDNGVPFLRALYTNLTNSNEFITETCSTASSYENISYLPPLYSIRAGSWINANFSIWIGDNDDRRGWSLLAKARLALEEAKARVDIETYNKALDEALIAEGSDWFWWYGPEHQAENKDEFDMLFRYHIANIYKIIRSDVPADVHIPITEQSFMAQLELPKSKINPKLTGIAGNNYEWENAGTYNAKSVMSAMHQIGELIEKVLFGNNDESLFLRIIYSKFPEINDIIRVKLKGNNTDITFTIGDGIINIESESKINISYVQNDCIDLEIKNLPNNLKNIEIQFRSISYGSEISYPRNGFLKIDFN